MTHQKNLLYPCIHSHIQGFSDIIAAFYRFFHGQQKLFCKESLPVISRNHQKTCFFFQGFLTDFQTDRFQQRRFAHRLHNPAASQHRQPALDAKSWIKGFSRNFFSSRDFQCNPDRTFKSCLLSSPGSLCKYHPSRHGINRPHPHRTA